MAKNVQNGKAFEYACLKAIHDKMVSDGKTVAVDDSPAFRTAMHDFNLLSASEQTNYIDAANSAVRLIFPLEPRLDNGNDTLLLAVNADSAAQGVSGDVRDVLCIRNTGKWEIGISCKHNHEALKHPRITQDMDFGLNWVGIANSSAFIADISTTINTLVSFMQQGKKWEEVAATDEIKWDTYYVPILKAYRDEIIRMCATYPDIPKKLLSYFFGSKDFYKVIMKEKQKTTTIEGFNMSGTLNQKAGSVRPLIHVPVIQFPTRLIEADFKKNRNGKLSKTTLMLVFDGGWTVSMRLHNKDKYVKLTGLAWDVQLVGLPTGIYVSTNPW